MYPAPVLVVGTFDKDGKANVMTASWGGICCSEPPCVAVSLRKVTYSHGNILERQAFTLSIPSEKYVEEADYFGLVSGRTIDRIASAYSGSPYDARPITLNSSPYFGKPRYWVIAV